MMKLLKSFYKKDDLNLKRQSFNLKRDVVRSEYAPSYGSGSIMKIRDYDSTAEDKILQNISKYSSNPLETVFTVYSNFTTYKPDSKNFEYEKLLTITEKLVEYPKAFETLNRLSPKSQFDILTGIIMAEEDRYVNWSQGYSVGALLEVIELANYPELVLINDLSDKKTIAKFLKITHKKTKTQSNSLVSSNFRSSANRLIRSISRDTQYLYKENSQSTMELILSSKSDNVYTVLSLLRSIYDEARIIEILEKVDAEDADWTLLGIVRLAKEWDSLKAYPLSWSLATMSEALKEQK